MQNKEAAKLLLQKLEKVLKLRSWKVSESKDWFRHGIAFYEKKENVWNSFGLLFEEENECTIAFGFWSNIFYPKVEEILVPILVKNDLVGSDYMKGESSSSFNSNEYFKNVLPEKGIRIESEEDVNKVVHLLLKFINEDSLPFFKNWSSLIDLHKHLKKLPEEREILSDTLGIFYQLKKATIYRLCNDDSALDYIESYYKKRKIIYEKYPDEITAKRYYEASKELKDCLSKTNPIYV